MKKTYLMIMMTLAAAALTGCSSSTPNTKPAEEIIVNEVMEETEDVTPVEEEPVKEEQISQVLYDEDGLKITFTGMYIDELWGDLQVKLAIENNMDRGITIQTRDESIHGYMIEGIFSADIMPGKKINDKVTYTESDLKENGIDEVETIDMTLRVTDEETWDEIKEIPVTLNFK